MSVGLVDTLLVETSMDTSTVTLGPSRRMVARSGVVVILGALAMGWALAGPLGPIAASVLSLGGAGIGGVLRIRGWMQHEAPLEVQRGRHSVVLRRVFRGRVLGVQTVSLAELQHVEVDGDTLVLRTVRGQIRLVAGYRSPEELSSVAGWLQAFADDEGTVERHAELERLLQRT